MKHLVSPGYGRSNLIGNLLAPNPERILEFRGLNRRSVVDEGEMSYMENLSADKYPVLAPRRPRAYVDLPSGVVRPLQLLTRYGKLAMIAVDEDDDVNFYFDGTKVDMVYGLTAESRAVAINTKICFFPDKKYLSLHKASDGSIVFDSFGSLENTTYLTSKTLTISNEDCRITLSTGRFKYDDAVNISGTLYYTDAGGTSKNTPANVSCVIEQVITAGNDDTYVLPRESFIELTGEGATNISITGTIKRTAPDLDYVIEWNNRLWGACNADNTIYACKLGDPTNWQYFQGTGLDSYYAQQGTDEEFTGVGEYSGHIIFFKPDSMCRIYGTAPANYQVTNTKCYGVEQGSALSVVTVNDTVFYKSSVGIMAYQGGVPFCISDRFNSDFKNVVAGTEGRKYYACCQNPKYGIEVMVLDIEKEMWHKEDDMRFRTCCTIDNRLYCGYSEGADPLTCDTDVYCDPYLTVEGQSSQPGGIIIVNPKVPTEDKDSIDWMAVFGPFDEYIEEHKIYSKLALRFRAAGPCSARVLISIDEGDWELVKEYSEVSTRGEFIPIIPRRCDRYSVKIEGTGDIEIKSLTRRVRPGTFGRIG